MIELRYVNVAMFNDWFRRGERFLRGAFYFSESDRWFQTDETMKGFSVKQNMTMTYATEADIPDLAGLLALLFSQEVEFTPDREAQEMGLRRIITHPETGFILVGKINDCAVAMVNILFTVSTALGQRVAILEDMFVSPSHRNSGLGSRLLNRAIAEARHHGCGRITLLTDHTNETGQGFYKHHGFMKSTMIPYRLSLNP